TSIKSNVILPDRLPALNFAGADSGVRFNNLSPRGGITYDLRGNGKTVLKANGARYYGLGLYTASVLEPTTPTTLRFRWRDLNGDNIVQPNELDLSNLLSFSSNYDPSNPSAVFAPTRVDPNLKNDVTDEAIVGVDHELMNNFGVGVSYIYRKYHQFQGQYRTDPADVTSSFVPVTYIQTCGNPSLCGSESFTGVYYQRPVALKAAQILRNNTQYNTYN